MADINKILGKLMGSGAAIGFAGGLAGGFAGNMLAGKKGLKLGKKAVKMGGIAAVGALAYSAYQRYNASKTQAIDSPERPSEVPLRPAPEGSAFLPSQNDPAAHEELGLTLVRAMVAAARSDGRLDAKESQTIFQRIEALGLGAEETALLVEEMGRPVDMDGIIRSAKSPEIAAEVYVASLLAIDVDTTEEQSYLAMLAARLKLPRDLVTQLHQQVKEQLSV